MHLCRLMNSEKWHMVEREITFITTFLANEGSTLCFFFVFFAWLKATQHPIPIKLTFYERG